ncbi:MAG: hypothetical protein GF398_00485 [Chitinivibrionales bacterium]|nr:hypothetical protein [Chitinivibrionales bacterium]
MRNAIVLVVFLSVAGTVTTCTSPSNPLNDPGNASIDKQKTFAGVDDTLMTSDTAYQCSAWVLLTEFVDSFQAYVILDGDTNLAAQGSVDRELVLFDIFISEEGEYRLVFVISIRDDAETTDTLSIGFIARGAERKAWWRAGIDESASLKFDDTLTTSAEPYLCSMVVALPELLDSFYIGFTTPDLSLISSGSVEDSLIVAPFWITRQDSYAMCAAVIKDDSARTVDSLCVTFYGDGQTVNPHTTAMIDAMNSLSCIRDTLELSQPVSCGLALFRPQFIDSFVIVLAHADQSDTLARGAVGAESYSFDITADAPGAYEITAGIIKGNGDRDSVHKSFFAYSNPVVHLDSSRYSVHAGEELALPVSVRDFDGDLELLRYQISQTNTIAPQWESVGLNSDSDSKALTIKSNAFDTLYIFALAKDTGNNASEIAQCTVFVLDTVKPAIAFVRLNPSADDSTVNTLPCTLSVAVADSSLIDSVKFGNRPMDLAGDTAWLVITSGLSQGAKQYPVYAWDRAGNKGEQKITIVNNENSTFKPEITLTLGQTIKENELFDTIYLDSHVNVLSGAPYDKSEISWLIADNAGGLTFTLDQARRMITVAIPDSEWNGAENVTFTAKAPNQTFDDALAAYRVTGINDPPRISNLFGQCAMPGDTFKEIEVKSIVYDPDDELTDLMWNFDAGKGDKFHLSDSGWVTFSMVPIMRPVFTRTDSSLFVYPNDSSQAPGYDDLRFEVFDDSGASASRQVRFRWDTQCAGYSGIEIPVLEYANCYALTDSTVTSKDIWGVIYTWDVFDRNYTWDICTGYKRKVNKDVFRQNIVLTVLKYRSGYSGFSFAPRSAGKIGDTLYFHYDAFMYMPKQQQTLVPAPEPPAGYNMMIISIPKDNYYTFKFIENGNEVKSITPTDVIVGTPIR